MRTSRPESPSVWTGAAALFLDACLLVRNIFIYALPGGLFFLIGLVSHRLNLAQINTYFAPYHPPSWALGLLLIAACYLAGRLLFAIVSLRVEFWKVVHWSDPDWLAEYPTEVTARDLVLRHYFPDMFLGMERRETGMRLTFASIAALLIGWLIFIEFHPAFGDVIIWTAGLLFLATLGKMTQLGRVRKAIHAAGEEIEAREKAAREAEAVIQPTGDELRFIIDSIFKAAELTSQRQSSSEADEPEPPRTTRFGNGAQSPSAEESTPAFGLPRL
ncbi:MAG TPA: hypothetical protein VJR26_12940 [Candidatus Acidoferrales bacterium]|nr:hypothetical protein [Candidatus Acidoferrales bacterium]